VDDAIDKAARLLGERMALASGTAT
jgi:hypothetical protein